MRSTSRVNPFRLLIYGDLDVGAISDASSSKYRRRYWVVTSTLALVVSTVTLAYCKDIAGFFVDLFGVGEGSWDPQRNKTVSFS